MASNHGLRRLTSGGLRILAVAAAYFAVAEAGLLAEIARRQVSPLWPATGVALVCLLLLGWRVWPGIALGAFLSNLVLGISELVSAALALGTTLSLLCAYWLLRRVGFSTELERLRDALALVFLAAFAGMLLSATVGAGALVVSGGTPARDFWQTWMLWWTGDALGVLIVAPVLLMARRLRWPRGVRWYRWVEGAALVVGTFAAMVVAVRSLEVIFVAFPFLIWAGFRFQLVGTAPVALIAATVAVDAQARGLGPFGGHGLAYDMVILQLFNGSVALVGLVLAALIAERDRAQRDIEQTVGQLADVVNHLERGTGFGNPAKRWDLPPGH
ncbi:MASE1 domain-containing protein [Actinopolymorpha alba]|uniref:MASE1 domain-containing protein n=1 Tax=Actinopolymorpha alba TaxID=533267 RepID=UPI00036F3684|nr:MASE1 domain-containing protein [Actinopolymorpha alba]